jgi:hypothetical protein
MLCSVGSAAIGLALSPIRVRAAVLTKTAQEPAWLIVNDPRPVKVAAAELERRYGWLITYEDPPYQFVGELEDVSKLPGTVVMDLRHQRLELASPLPPAADNPDRVALLNAVIAADANQVGHSRFTLRSSTFGMHLVPSAFRDANGVWSVTTSILDSPIDMPAGQVSVMTYMEEFRSALFQATGKEVTLATTPYRLLASRNISQAATRQPASEVLIRVLQSIDVPLTWRLLCSPEAPWGYYLNIVPPG